ncbi:MAG: TonB-dependent receptor [Flavobacteriaceae bacterium]|jgi:hypothetical protein|nr:TonB-dependent receptor [Flavobacteriaceae bacterium]
MQNVFKTLLCIITAVPIFSFAQKEEQDSINKIVEQQIKEVEITANKKLIERKVDRLVFNVENSISAAGGDAIDALKVTPGLRVENDQISIVGKSGVSVMIDDRILQLSGDDLTNYLKSLPSDNIKSIEVITTPPAKYDAEGNSGIVNIVLKKAKKDDIYNASIRSSYQQGIYAVGSAGGNISSRIKKLSLAANVNYQDGSYKIIRDNKYFYPKGLWEENIKEKRNLNTLYYGLNTDYQLSEKSEIGISYSGYSRKSSDYQTDNISIYDDLNEYTGYYSNSKPNNYDKNYLHSISSYYTTELDSLGKSVSANIDYLVYNQKTDGYLDTDSFIDGASSFTSSFNTGIQDIKIFTSGIDVELPFENIKYTFGGKLSFADTNNSFDFYDTTTGQNILDLNQSNVFDYKENTQALYASAEKKIKNWEFQFGLRAESTQTTGYSKNLNQTNKNNYLKLFPTAYISYAPNDNNTFGMNYSKRIGRPSFYMANPFRIYSNPFSYIEGNPLIRPDYIHSIELSHTYKNNLNTSLGFSYQQDGRNTVTIIDPNTNISKTTYLNFFKRYAYNLNISHTFNKWKWWESNNSLMFGYDYAIADEQLNNQKLDSYSFYASSYNTFTLNSGKTFFAGLNITYLSPFSINVTKSAGRIETNLSFRYLLMDKNMQISLIVNDIFKTDKYKMSSYSNNVLAERLSRPDRQYFRLALSYKFGNKKINVQQHETGNEDEQRRL